MDIFLFERMDQFDGGEEAHPFAAMHDRLEAVWKIVAGGCREALRLIQALDVDPAEPRANGPNCQEDEALSQ